MSVKGVTQRRKNRHVEPESFLGRISRLSREASDHADEETRFGIAKEVLRDTLDLASFCPGANAASWNIAEVGTRQFDRCMPILIRPGNEPILDFFCSIALLRAIIDRHLDRLARKEVVAWGHFIMGTAPRKAIIQADLKGTPGIKGILDARYHPRKQNHGLGILCVYLSADWLTRFLSTHASTLQKVHELARDTRSQLQLTPDGSYLLARVDKLVQTMPSALESKEGQALVQAVGPLVEEVESLDLGDDFLREMGKAFDTKLAVEGLDAVGRQMLFHAYVCPCPDRISTLGYIPDVSYRSPVNRNELSSLALQVFLPNSLPVDAEEWHMWSSLVSMVGREKSVHDFSRRAEQLGFQQGEYMISHEVDTPIGILNLERDRLSAEGKLAIDYMEMWRRFVKREWSEALPEELDELFRKKSRLFEIGFRFGYARALRRSQVPKRVVNGRLEFWPYSDLLQQTGQWLDFDIELPDRLLYGESAWVFQVKTWLLFFLIASCQHVIKYAFAGVARFDDWSDAKGVRRAQLTVTCRRRDRRTHVIEIANSGDDRPPEPPCHTDVIRPIGSGEFGSIEMPVPQRDKDRGAARVVTIHPSRRTPGTGIDSARWVAEIVINEPRRDNNG